MNQTHQLFSAQCPSPKEELTCLSVICCIFNLSSSFSSSFPPPPPPSLCWDFDRPKVSLKVELFNSCLVSQEVTACEIRPQRRRCDHEAVHLFGGHMTQGGISNVRNDYIAARRS